MLEFTENDPTAEITADGHGVGLIVLGADDERDRLRGVEPHAGRTAFHEYFCFGFAGCESGDVDAGARSHPHVVFFELLGRAVGEYADDLSLEFGFEGLCLYCITPPHIMAVAAIRNRIFFIIVLI